MENPIIVPFDLNTAKKINTGEIVGQIVTEKGRNRAEIVYEDNSSSCQLLVVIHSIPISVDWFFATGKAISSENRLLFEVPEYTTFKDGDVLSNGDWVRCVLCGAQMLLPCGADKCPECGENGTLRWVDEERQEIDAKGLDCLDYVRELRVDDYLSPTTLEEIAEEIKKKVNRG